MWGGHHGVPPTLKWAPHSCQPEPSCHEWRETLPPALDMKRHQQKQLLLSQTRVDAELPALFGILERMQRHCQSFCGALSHQQKEPIPQKQQNGACQCEGSARVFGPGCQALMFKVGSNLKGKTARTRSFHAAKIFEALRREVSHFPLREQDFSKRGDCSWTLSPYGQTVPKSTVTWPKKDVDQRLPDRRQSKCKEAYIFFSILKNRTSWRRRRSGRLNFKLSNSKNFCLSSQIGNNCESSEQPSSRNVAVCSAVCMFVTFFCLFRCLHVRNGKNLSIAWQIRLLDNLASPPPPPTSLPHILSPEASLSTTLTSAMKILSRRRGCFIFGRNAWKWKREIPL